MQKEKNVLLLALSEFNTHIKEDNYYYVKTGKQMEVVASRYQLEPGSKYIICDLAKSNRKIDKIYMLCTEEALKKTVEFNEMTDISPKEYYIEKVKQFVTGESQQIDFSQIDDSATEIFGDNEMNCMNLLEDNKKMYTEEVLSQMFNEVEVVEGKEYSAISEIVMSILPMKNEAEKINIFVDMQGGKRNTIFTLNAVLNMLKNNDISVEKSIAIAYQRGKIIHNIIDETKSYNIFDLVSGMDEFFSYGKGKKFCEYYDKLNSSGAEDSYEKKIVNLIRDVSDAVELCNVVEMERGIERLAREIQKYMNLENDVKEPLFASLVPMLDNEYRNLLKGGVKKSGKVVVDRIAIIEWCLKKGLYQQALTLAESKVPEQIVRDNILYYCVQGDEAEFNSAKKYFINEKNNLKDEQKFLINDVSRYFIKNLIKSCNHKFHQFKNCIFRNKNLRGLHLYTNVRNTEDNKDNLARLIEKYDDLVWLRNNSNHASSEKKY
ncbi:MAG: TM1812 family CRISPR-associated protein [Lachnospiraceae bacterium]|nr:TM1812 family CRISPR-associated protein [Lachnospiraceae bacterium]